MLEIWLLFWLDTTTIPQNTTVHTSLLYRHHFYFSVQFTISMVFDIDMDIVDSRSRSVTDRWGLIWSTCVGREEEEQRGKSLDQAKNESRNVCVGHVQTLWKVLQCWLVQWQISETGWETSSQEGKCSQRCNGLFLCSVCNDLNRAWPFSSLFLDL